MKIDKIPAVTLTQNNIQNHQNQVLKQIIAKQNANGLVNQDLSSSKAMTQDLKMTSQELKNLTPLENQIKDVLENSKLPVTKDQITNIKQLLIGLQSTKEKAFSAIKNGDDLKFTQLVNKEVVLTKQTALNQVKQSIQNVELLQKGDSSISVSNDSLHSPSALQKQNVGQQQLPKSEGNWIDKDMIDKAFMKEMPQKIVSLKQIQLPVTIKNVVIQDQFLNKNEMIESINKNIIHIKNQVDQTLRGNIEKSQMILDPLDSDKQLADVLDKSSHLHNQINSITKHITTPLNMTKEDMAMLREMTEEIHRVIEESGEKSSSKTLMTDLAQLQDKTHFFEMINQEMYYEMLPMIIEEREHQTEFFVKKNQNGDKEKDFYKVALALETFHLGEVDCILTQNKEHIEVEIRVPDEEVKKVFENQIDLLVEKIDTIVEQYDVKINIKTSSIDVQNFLEEEVSAELDVII